MGGGVRVHPIIPRRCHEQHPSLCGLVYGSLHSSTVSSLPCCWGSGLLTEPCAQLASTHSNADLTGFLT